MLERGITKPARRRREASVAAVPSKAPRSVDVLFITDAEEPRTLADATNGVAENFDPACAELFLKMMTAAEIKSYVVVGTSNFPVDGLVPREISAKFVVALGDDVAKRILKIDGKTDITRGAVIESSDESRIICTLHPRELIRNPELKREAWRHLQFIRDLIHAPK